MAQHDYIISNQTFPNTRADINNLASAIATNNSGTSAPTTQYAGQFWIDTTASTWTMYIHDGSDDIQFAQIDTSANTVNFIDSVVTGFDIVTDTTPQLGGNLDTNNKLIQFGDSSGGTVNRLQFGASQDLQIYHDGSHSYILDSGTGNLTIRGTELRLNNSNNSLNYITCTDGGATTLFHNGASKLATTSTGVDVTGTAVTDGLTVAGNLSVDGGTIKLDGNYPTSTGNVALGDTALDSLTSGVDNTAIGESALTTNTSGNYNTAVGKQALRDNTTGIHNVAVGQASLMENETGDYNTALGRNSLRNNTASNNTSVGYQSLNANTTGTNNVAVGYQALFGNTTGIRNVAVGTLAGNTNSTGQENTYIGRNAGLSATTASQNTFVGQEAGTVITTGGSNTFVGRGAGSAITTGSSNTIIGRYNGNQNGLDLRVSSNNVVISDGAGNLRQYIDASGSVIIGATSTPDGSSGGIGFIAESNSRKTLITASTTTSDTTLVVFRNPNGTVGGINTSGSSTAFNTSSDYRLKENVVDITDATTRLKQLSPKRFNFISDADTTVDGFLAHEVSDIVPEAISGTKDEVDAEGNPVYQGIDQSKLVPLLVATIKELEARITALEGA